MSFANIRIVLVETKHPGNTGATARAMKTMGLSDLVLVRPAQFPAVEATARATGAADILAQATVYPDLTEALSDCVFVLGASARVRGVAPDITSPPAAMTRLLQESREYPCALVFGREDRGLTNDELQLCHAQVCIPASPEFSSLNLAAAVQVLCYELRMCALRAAAESGLPDMPAYPPATSREMESFYTHLEVTLKAAGFFKHGHSEKIMAKLRKLYNRARPDGQEIKILRGILTETQRGLTRPGADNA